jgi:DNA-binding NtrC family response regulator
MPSIMTPESTTSEFLRVVPRVLLPGKDATPQISSQTGPQSVSRMRHSPILGRSPAMQRLLDQMQRAMPHLRVCAIEGESGTGKTLVASELHRLGPACDGPFVAIAAASFRPEVIPSGGGMLVVEQLHEMPIDRQAMLLELLRHQDAILPEPGRIPLQIVATSCHSLRSLVANGSLLPDLCIHLTAVRFSLPRFRERHEDVPLLADFFLARYAAKYRKPIQGLATGSLARLYAHSWPGNVRELKSVLESAVLSVEGQWIRPIDLVLTPAIGSRPLEPGSQATPPEDLSLNAVTRRHVAAVLSLTGGNKKRTANLLGISRSTLYRLMS